MDTALQLKLIETGILVLIGHSGYTARLLITMDKRIDKHEQTLYGENGTNGVVGTIKSIRARAQRLSNRIHSLTGKVGLVTTLFKNDLDRLKETNT